MAAAYAVPPRRRYSDITGTHVSCGRDKMDALKKVAHCRSPIWSQACNVDGEPHEPGEGCAGAAGPMIRNEQTKLIARRPRSFCEVAPAVQLTLLFGFR
jgi:hypothetical protein